MIGTEEGTAVTMFAGFERDSVGSIVEGITVVTGGAIGAIAVARAGAGLAKSNLRCADQSFSTLEVSILSLVVFCVAKMVLLETRFLAAAICIFCN